MPTQTPAHMRNAPTHGCGRPRGSGSGRGRGHHGCSHGGGQSSKPTATPARRAMTVVDDSDDDTPTMPQKSPSKCRKKTTKKVISSDDNSSKDAKPVITLTAYIWVVSDIPMKKRGDQPTVQQGSFTFTTATSYNELLHRIVNTLPCPRRNIATDRIMWVPL